MSSAAVVMYGPAHKILIIMTLSCDEGSGESYYSHTQSMVIDDDSDH